MTAAAAIAALWAAAAWAGSPAPYGVVAAVGQVEGPDTGTVLGGGGGLTAGVELVGPLAIELGLDASWATPGRARVAVWPQLRLDATRRHAGGATLSFAAGVGSNATLGDDARLLFTGSAAVDVRLRPAVDLRVEAGWLGHVDALAGARLALGVRFGRPPRAPETPDTLWIGAPECRWADPAEALAYVKGLDPETRDGLLLPPRTGEERAEQAEAAAASLRTDRVLVLPPGARVELGDGSSVVVGPSGALALPSGVTVTRVVHAGGSLTALFVPPEGRVAWERVTPEPVEPLVRFAHGSADLTPAAVAELGVWARDAVGASWSIVGSYSEVGDAEVNAVLAQARAEAVRDALLAVGLPAERIAVVTTAPPDLTLALDDQRAVRVLRFDRGAP